MTLPNIVLKVADVQAGLLGELLRWSLRVEDDLPERTYTLKRARAIG